MGFQAPAVRLISEQAAERVILLSAEGNLTKPANEIQTALTQEQGLQIWPM